MSNTKRYLSDSIRNIDNFPKQGIIYRDITTLLKDSSAFKNAADLMYEHYKTSGADKIVCIESRGFILGSILANNLCVGFVPIRKKGKLPAEVVSIKYDLEYGDDVIEIHRDSISKGDNVILHDDLLATGGTMCAAIKLVESLGANIIGISFLIELKFLQGREKINKYDVFSLIEYDS